jgi:aryl-alcohol dehydrogenase-like predicted oxidoreductase
VQKRPFGKTNFDVSILTLGGYGVGFIEQEKANPYIEKALDAGLNIIDVAPTYGKAESRLAPFVKQYRDKLFIAEKTAKRTKEEAWDELQQSLKRLGTDYFDLYQFHGVNNLKELDQIFSNDGAMTAFKEAKESDIIKHIGITGHGYIPVHIEALKRFDFDTVLLPVNIASMVSPDPANDYRPLLEMAVEKNVGVIAIKAIAQSRWKREQNYQTWYQPMDKQEEINQAINFTLTQKGVTTYSIAGDYRLWSKILKAGENFKQLDKKEMDKAIDYGKKHNYEPLFPEKE